MTALSLNSVTENDLHSVYLSSVRQRFKAEINRLTGGDMQALLGQRLHAKELSFPLTYLYAWHWLQHNVHTDYHQSLLQAFSRGRQAFLMQILLTSESSESFIHAYIQHWLNYTGQSHLQYQQFLTLYQYSNQDTNILANYLIDQWHSLEQFNQSHAEVYRQLGLEERQRYRDFSSDDELERLRLIDQLPDIEPLPETFDKLGLIPSMACPQTCRHCMFIWRPIMKDTADPGELFRMVNGLTRSVLFTGGDLTKQLDDFYRAITSMKDVSTFAILLNGDFAQDIETTDQVLSSMVTAIRRRPANWPEARIMLQISFDEVHQEVLVDKQGQLKERIPVKKIANIVELAPRYKSHIQLALLHKQNVHNFSMDLFNKGVFARLVKELGQRGHQVQVLSAQPSSRLKPNPAKGGEHGQLIRDANFCLTQHPDAPILLTSSTVDAYGRASTLDKHETTNNRELLLQMLDGKSPQGECFDTDLMFWFNGWVTLFSAVHINLGDVYRDGIDRILRRWNKDPLTRALHEFDSSLLDDYREIRTDLELKLAMATGPHQLFHSITERADVRLHMTKKLIQRMHGN